MTTALALPSRAQRSRRVGAIAAGLVAVVAGVAIAFFLSTQSFNNSATGATMQDAVATGLPIAQTDLFPTKELEGGKAAKVGSFIIENPNAVRVDYKLSAACSNCAADSHEEAQWDELYIKIVNDKNVTVYNGKLADMTGTPQIATGHEPPKDGYFQTKGKAGLGKVDGATGGTAGSRTYTYRLWLNDTGAYQEDGVTTLWTFTLDGQTAADNV